MKRFWKHTEVPENQWSDWRWQQRNRLDSHSDLKSFFPNIAIPQQQAFRSHIQKFNLAITPYALSLIEYDDRLNPAESDPIWNQFRFLKDDERSGATDYDGTQENWEAPEEMPTPILHHKYPDRAIIRIINTCFGHCNYCYLTSRVLDKNRQKGKVGDSADWSKSLDYLQANPQIRDVLISGGDPLILENDRIDQVLTDLARIKSIQSVRINTRVLTFNPYRLDQGLAQVIKKHRVTALEIHVAHPRELSETVDERLSLLDESGYRPLILWRAPLLYGINDSEDVLKELLVKLYQRRITPYYLFHFAPYALGRTAHGVSVRRGAELLANIRREIPGPAFPQYALFHVGGKHDIPLDSGGTSEFVYTLDDKDRPIVKFKNWKNKWVTYADVDDAQP
jgi:lysine 2,3-aminomutase